MSKEYINRELLENALEDENKNGNFVFTANWIMEIVDNLPNADVVPKSEVERLEHLRAELSKEIETLKDNKEHLAVLLMEAKSEVAREICCKIEEEIVAALESNYKAKSERMANTRIDADEFISYCDGKISALRGIEAFVEELKKKYTA